MCVYLGVCGERERKRMRYRQTRKRQREQIKSISSYFNECFQQKGELTF